MTELDRALRDIVSLFERREIPYVLMGGLTVRVYGIPRPTYDIDFTLAIPRPSLPEFYRTLQELGYTVPEAYLTGWLDNVAGMPVVKIRFFGIESGVDVDFFSWRSRNISTRFYPGGKGKRSMISMYGLSVRKI